MLAGLCLAAVLAAIAKVSQGVTAGQVGSLFLSPEQACRQYIQGARQLEESVASSAESQAANPQGVIDASRSYLTSAFACLLYQRLGLVAESEATIDEVMARLKALPRPPTHLGSRLLYCTIERVSSGVHSTVRMELHSEQHYGLIATLSELWGLESAALVSVQVIKRLLKQQQQADLENRYQGEAIQLEIESLHRALATHGEGIAQLRAILASAGLDLVSLGLLCHVYHELRGFLWAYAISGETPFQKLATGLQDVYEAGLAEPPTRSCLQAAVPECVAQREDALQILKNHYKRMLWQRLEGELAQGCPFVQQVIEHSRRGEELDAHLRRMRVKSAKLIQQTMTTSNEFSRIAAFWLSLSTSKHQAGTAVEIDRALHRFVQTDYEYFKGLAQSLQLQLELTLSVGYHLDCQPYRNLDQVLRAIARAIQCAQRHPGLSSEAALERYRDLAGNVERHAYLIYSIRTNPLPLLDVSSKGVQNPPIQQ